MDPNFLENFLQANNFLIQGHLEEAIALYSNLISTEQNFDLLINRCVAYIKKGDYNSALTDSEAAIFQDPIRYEGYYYRGISNFSLGKFSVALNDFSEAKTKKIPAPLIDTWIPKCNLEIKLEPKKKKKEEEPVPVPKPVEKVLEKQPEKEKDEKKEGGKENDEKENDEKKNDEKEKDEKKNGEKKNEEKEEEEEHFDLVKEKVFSSTGLFNYSWYQTDNHVGLEFEHKIENKDIVKHKFEARKVEISFPIQGSTKPFELMLDLWDEVLPETAKIILTLTKLEIKFEKKNKKKNWIRLESEDKPKKIIVQEIEKPPSYPSSSRYKKDWSKIDRELDEELSQDKDEDALNKVFKEIYKNADENTRRAMIKSFQTSGGTVL